MKLPFLLALLALPILAVCAQAQDPEVPLIDDLSPARKASPEARQAPPRAPIQQTGAGATAANQSDVPSADDRSAEPFVGEMPKDLSAALSRALERNPQILIAEAKVHQAQAELSDVKFKVISKVTGAFRLYVHYKRLAGIKHPNPDQNVVAQCRDQLESAELELIGLLGIDAESYPSPLRPAGAKVYEKVSDSSISAELRSQPDKSAPWVYLTPADAASPKKQRAAQPSAIPKALRAVLAEKTDLEFEGQTLREVLEYLVERHGVQFIDREIATDTPITLRIKGITLAAALQAIADLTDHCFVLRDYGILVLHPGDATKYMENDVPMIAPDERSPIAEQPEVESKPVDKN